MGSPPSTEKTVAGKVKRLLHITFQRFQRRKGPMGLVFPGGSEVQGGPKVEGTEAVVKEPSLRS